VFINNRPPFYKIDWEANRLTVRGPQSDDNWDEIIAVMNEYQIGKLNAGGITDRALRRVTRLEALTDLDISSSKELTDEGLLQLARMPQLQTLFIGGPSTPITDRGLAVLQQLRELRRFESGWTSGISDAGLTNLSFCEHLEKSMLWERPAAMARFAR